MCIVNFSEDFLPEIIEKSYPLHELLLSKGKILWFLKEKPFVTNSNLTTGKPNVNPLKIRSVIIEAKEDNKAFIESNVQLYHEIKILIACMTMRHCMKNFLMHVSIRNIN